MSTKQVQHPLYLHKLSLLRDERVRPKQFRELVQELSILVGVLATETLDLTTTKQLNSPIGPFTGVKLKDAIGIFPIMRAGNGMVDVFYRLMADDAPSSRILQQAPKFMSIAGTAIAAVNILKDWGLKRIIFCTLLGSKAGVEALRNDHPDIEIVVGAIDEQLTDEGYIYPGVGDAGDRLFKTHY